MTQASGEVSAGSGRPLVLRLLPGGRSFAAIILDQDGLMIDTEAASYRAWHRAAADFGWSIPADRYQQLAGRKSEDSFALLASWWQEEPGERGSLEDVAAAARRYAAAEPATVKDGLTDLLEWAGREQVPVAVASSSKHRNVVSRMTTAGLLGAFAVVIGGDEVIGGKPQPDIFLLAAERLGCDPAHCVVCEDSDNGIRAAAAAGTIPFLVPDVSIPRDVPPEITDLAYRTCRSLTEVLGIVSGGHPGA